MGTVRITTVEMAYEDFVKYDPPKPAEKPEAERQTYSSLKDRAEASKPWDGRTVDGKYHNGLRFRVLEQRGPDEMWVEWEDGKQGLEKKRFTGPV